MSDSLPANWTRIMCDGMPVFEGVLELPYYLDIETAQTASLMGTPVRVLAVRHVHGVRHIGVTTDMGDRP